MKKDRADERVQLPYPKSVDGILPVGFVGRMGGIGSLFEIPGGRRR